MTSIAQRIAEIASQLPAEKQTEVLDFVEFLRKRTEPDDSHAAPVRPARRFGTLAGRLDVPEDLDTPLPADVQRFFDGD